jgi:predicted Zn-dependent protease
MRPLLLHICVVTEEDLNTRPEDYIRALSRLGQFDLDQSRLKDAESELKKALDLGTQKKVSKELQVLLMRSWADVLNQTNKQKESQAILKKADEMEKTATDMPVSEKP